MSGKPKEWDYTCPADNCANRIQAAPVPNVVKCGICGRAMEVYAIEEGQ